MNKPFLKWAGGKTQLLDEIRNLLPKNFEQKETFVARPTNVGKIQLPKEAFLLESLEGDKNWSRYTIIGCSSGDYIEVYDNDVYKYSNFQITDKFNVINPLEWIQRFFLTHKMNHYHNLNLEKQLPQISLLLHYLIIEFFCIVVC